MNTYYIFELSKINFIESVVRQLAGRVFFDVKIHRKSVRQTNIPLSSTQLDEFLIEYREVIVLETDLSDVDASLRNDIESKSEFFSQNSESVLKYLQHFETE